MFMIHNQTIALSGATNEALLSSESNSVINSAICLECLSLIRALKTSKNQIKNTVINSDV